MAGMQTRPIIAIAENYETAAQSLPAFPDGADITFYLLRNAGDALLNPYIDDGRIKVHYREFYISLFPLAQKNDLLSTEVASTLAQSAFEVMARRIKKMGAFHHEKELADAVCFYIENKLFYPARAIIGLQTLLDQDHDFYLVPSDARGAHITHILNYVDADISTERISLYRLQGDAFIKHAQTCAAPETSEPTLEQDAQQSFHDFTALIKGFDLGIELEDYAIASIAPTDRNYNQAARQLCNEMMKNHSILAITLNSVHESVLAFCEDYKALSESAGKRFQMRSVNPRDILPVEARRNTAWHKAIAGDLTRTQTTWRIKGVDYSVIIQNVLPDIMHIGLPTFFLIAAGLDRAFKAHPPAYCLTSPGRSAHNWLLLHMCKKHGVPTGDVQALFQTANPRYKPSQADTYFMINDEQLDLYRDNFYIPEHQTVGKYGSILFCNVIEKVKTIDADKVRKELGATTTKTKLITFATQYLNTDHCLRILDILCKALHSENVKFIVKTHPKEKQTNLVMYQEMIKKHDCADKAEVISDIDVHALVMASDLLITLFSNIGMEAALLGTDTWSVNLTEKAFPLSITKEGLAMDIQGEDAFTDALRDYCGENKISAQNKSQREAYFKDNDMLIDGRVAERIISEMMS